MRIAMIWISRENYSYHLKKSEFYLLSYRVGQGSGHLYQLHSYPYKALFSCAAYSSKIAFLYRKFLPLNQVSSPFFRLSITRVC